MENTSILQLEEWSRLIAKINTVLYHKAEITKKVAKNEHRHTTHVHTHLQTVYKNVRLDEIPE